MWMLGRSFMPGPSAPRRLHTGSRHEPRRSMSREPPGWPTGAVIVVVGCCIPRPTWSLMVQQPGTERATRPSRCWFTAAPSATPSRPSWRPLAEWSHVSACSTGRRGRAAPASSISAVADLRAGMPRTFFEDEYRTPLDYRDRRGDPGPVAGVGRLRADPRGGGRSTEPVRPDAPCSPRPWGSTPNLSGPTGRPTSPVPNHGRPTYRWTHRGSRICFPT